VVDMPGRKHPLLTGNIYHIYNKTIERRAVFVGEYCDKFIQTARYYRSSQSILRFSNFQKLPETLFSIYEKKVTDKRTFRVIVLAYCLMPTHYHMLIKQIQDKGISFFISQIQNSFTRFYNIKSSRTGPIFLEKFKSKLIVSEEQLKHTSRYIHLNPFSSGLIKKVPQILKYQYSSLAEYFNSSNKSLSNPNIILSFFANDKKRYKNFVLNNAEHQKMLEYCKYSNKW